MNARDFVGKLRDTELEKEIARKLREMPEGEAFQFILDLLHIHEIAALELAQKGLRNREYFRELLTLGLQRADASGIQRWLECVIPHLGMRRVLTFLTTQIDQYPDGVARALYFLPQMLPASDVRARTTLDRLQAIAKDKGLLRTPRMVTDEDGRIRFHPIEGGHNDMGTEKEND